MAISASAPVNKHWEDHVNAQMLRCFFWKCLECHCPAAFVLLLFKSSSLRTHILDLRFDLASASRLTLYKCTCEILNLSVHLTRATAYSLNRWLCARRVQPRKRVTFDQNGSHSAFALMNLTKTEPDQNHKETNRRVLMHENLNGLHFLY